MADSGDVRIAFASTNYGPLWSPVVASWLNCVAYTSRHMAVKMTGKLAGCGVTDRMYTMSAENRLVQDFLHEESLTHLFMTESDMIVPHDAIIKLLALDKDMASGVYFLRSSVMASLGKPCLYMRSPKYVREGHDGGTEYSHTPVRFFPKEEPFRVDCAGLGCLLIKRKVFEGLSKPWFDLSEGEGGIKYGSDIYFNKKAREAGFELWVDPTVRCGQVDYYVTDIEDYDWQVKNNPGFVAGGFIVGAGNGERTP